MMNHSLANRIGDIWSSRQHPFRQEIAQPRLSCAVLGLDLSAVNSNAVTKAVLGFNDTERKYPGIRNLLCNIIRMSKLLL